ncbi:hypothetical protein IV203_007728 [Nitzschia inconspicua]|uniref:Uncharacterized protein n=1 Tax=Nitzschia inconspicua TaxID=303405 RepID=A0A9K3KX81_9STRA|nr:hypothetical protein IV203_007728 [Nitzschia inconspicua]
MLSSSLLLVRLIDLFRSLLGVFYILLSKFSTNFLPWRERACLWDDRYMERKTTTYRQKEEEVQGVVFSTNGDLDDTSIDVVGVAEGERKERSDYDIRRTTPPPPTSIILPDFASALRVVQKQRRNLDSDHQEEQEEHHHHQEEQEQEQLQLIVDQHSRLLDDDDKNREGDTAHLEIDCNDVNFDYEGDQLEACKEQQATSSPTPAETDLSTIFPALGSNNGSDSGDIEFGPSVNTMNPTEFVADDAFGGGPGHGSDDGGIPPLPPITIANGIRLHVSMAIIHLENLTHENTDTIVTMCLRTISRVLNRYSHVVYVRDYLRTPERRQQLHGDLAVFEDEEKQPSYDDDDDDDDDDIRKLQLINLERNLRQRNSNIDDTNNESNNNSNSKDRQRTLGNHDTGTNTTNKQVKLILNNVHIQESPYMKNWYVIYADYAVYWMDSGRPILQSQVLWEINKGCDDVLDISLHRDDYWDLLTSLHFGQDLVLRRPDIEQPYGSYEKGLADCQDLGDEYDLDPFLPGNVGSGGGPPSMEIQDEEPSTNGTAATYPYVIATAASEIVWGTREWMGLALFLSTMVFAVSLLLIATVLHERQRKQELWGVNLTEAGVNDFLGVGWRYTQEEARAAAAMASLENDNDNNNEEEDDDNDTPQLFLQVYDKGRLGYNDDNSMLQGGIERLNPFGGDETVDPPNSSTAPTTMTPPQ